MPNECRITQARISAAQGSHKLGQRLILRGLVGKLVRAFELDADGKIVAGTAAAIIRLPRMPGSLRKRHILRQGTVTPDQHMSGDAHLAHLRKVAVGVSIEPVREQVVYPGTAEIAGREADAVDDDQLGRCSSRPRIAIRRSDAFDAVEPTGFLIDDHDDSTN